LGGRCFADPVSDTGIGLARIEALRLLATTASPYDAAPRPVVKTEGWPFQLNAFAVIAFSLRSFSP
jgi:hypothetical protein